MTLPARKLNKGIAFQVNLVEPRGKLDLTKKNNNGIRCFECRGCGHIQFECENVLEKKNSYNIALGDDTDDDTQPESDEEDSQVNNIAFHLQYESGNKAPTCVNINSLTISKDVEFNKKIDYSVIKAKNVKLLKENSQINALSKKSIEKLNKGKVQIDEILETGKIFGDITGLGYVNSVTTHLSLKTSSPCWQHLDSSCSQHMTSTITFNYDVRESTFAINDMNREEGSLPLYNVK
ncbi:hypothetical protein M9H77_12316 [Catharanthus roseus]|uniref:Uncharacterized protein n=1 Tax=Catharanthus roseus TaxID=4058 RepID=A0ACC0BH81_CATRO|nr:hypothetical protein M9H77_12316 [Catharanthus roseus]